MEDLKIYDEWNGVKKELQRELPKVEYFKERQIWWCSLGQNLGSETYGKGKFFRRPILVIKKLSNDLCVAVPLTSREKTGSWFIDITIGGSKKWAMLHQIRALNKKRLYVKIGELDDADFKKVKQKLEALLELTL